jgi:hypothetical protein
VSELSADARVVFGYWPKWVVSVRATIKKRRLERSRNARRIRYQENLAFRTACLVRVARYSTTDRGRESKRRANKKPDARARRRESEARRIAKNPELHKQRQHENYIRRRSFEDLSSLLGIKRMK